MIRLRRSGISLVLAGALAASAIAPASSAAEDALVRLPKRQPVDLPPSLLAQMTALQELDSAWLALASPELVARLGEAGASLEVLDAAPAGKAHHLVFVSDGPDMEALRRSGGARPVDEGVWLLATRGGNPRDMVPTEAALKPLAAVEGPVRVGASPSLPPAAGPLATLPGYRQTIAEMVAQVSRDGLARGIQDLEAFGTRYALSSNGQAAALAIRDELRRLGLATTMEDFTVGTTGRLASNVIATLPGRVDPSQVVVVSAHYDSYSDRADVLAPGADDNASGTAAVIELARVMSRYEFDFTVKLIAWGAEEQGLVGSRYYAGQAQQRAEQVLADLTLDMVGYVDQAPEDLELVVNTSSDWVYQRFAAAAASYAPLPLVRQVRATFGSDCTSFWEKGYPALCAIEDYPLRNPHYHRGTDRLETLDLGFVTSVTAATLATAADLAQPVSSPRAPAGLTAVSRIDRSVFSRAKTLSLSWSASSGAAGYHVYRSTTSHLGYQRLTAAPVPSPEYVDGPLDPEVTYYYVVTAVDSAGREGNFSAEAREGS